MLYQAGPVGSQQLERGVFARFATSLAGAWSAPLRIWSPDPVGGLFAGVGYGSALHQGQGVASMTGSRNRIRPLTPRTNAWGSTAASTRRN